jgi:selenocysteine-specific elongation factor
MDRSAAHHVIGTAGHIDHGKTSLVKALTGIDTDRLKEEKERGITIELGFAHLALPRHGVVGVVDVPGHERFVRTMVAGAVGIDLVVLVVAADEGVMPQTREHLDICGLLGIRRGLVALTKCDLVDDDLRELAALDVREALAGTFLQGAKVIPCSVVTGAGLRELVQAIDDALDEVPGRDPGGLLRLPVDRVFSMKGFGTVATGTLWAGRLRVGDELVALPGPRGVEEAPAKVRGVQVHGQAVQEAWAGQRTAVNLGLPREALLRGQTLVRPGTLAAGSLLDVRLRYLPSSRAPMKRRARVLLHAGTTQRAALLVLLDRGELLPGESALAQVHLSEPIVAQPGDRFILRGFALQKHHGTTLGGGEVLRVHPARHRRGTPALCATLRSVEEALAIALGRAPAKDAVELAGAERALVALEIARVGVAGVGLRDLLGRLPLPERRVQAALERLRSSQAVVRLASGQGEVYASQAALRLIQEAVLRAVADHHEAAPLSPGLGSELPARVGQLGGERDGVGEGRPQVPHPRLLQRAIEDLCEKGRLQQVAGAQGEVLRLPGHDPGRAQAAQGLTALLGRVEALYKEAGLQPPRPEEAAVMLGAEAGQVRTAVELLVRKGALLRIKDLLFATEAVDGLRQRLIAFLREHGEISPAQFKDLVGQTRKYTIPLAEHFDGEKLTLRVGEVRRLRGGSAAR